MSELSDFQILLSPFIHFSLWYRDVVLLSAQQTPGAVLAASSAVSLAPCLSVQLRIASMPCVPSRSDREYKAVFAQDIEILNNDLHQGTTVTPEQRSQTCQRSFTSWHFSWQRADLSHSSLATHLTGLWHQHREDHQGRKRRKTLKMCCVWPSFSPSTSLGSREELADFDDFNKWLENRFLSSTI